ncbi:hypothetical protein UFOVP642_21 [uncultured Caudovirales phage]|uniref:Tail completion protein n=1 Tax=uncultured Caudovirales phage TaxID=2100421 RepID=A0A6J5NB24_9CAUD|nr:hypothetical protein UFOVP642_21 [uncultured Caudovirales phage]
MTSRRELIMRNVVDTLTNQQTVRLGTITREPGVDILELANTAFPAVIVESGNEVRESITQGGAVQQRQATMAVNMQVWINTLNGADALRNSLIEGIEKLLDQDPTRGANAFDTQLIEIEPGTDTAPYSSMNLVFTIPYVYTKSNP